MTYSFIQIKLVLVLFSRLLISIKEWPLLCDLSDRLLFSIKCQSDCVESQSLFFKTDAKLLSEVPDHPKRTLEQRAHWPTGTVSLVTIAIKPDLAAQIHVECPFLHVYVFVVYECTWMCTWVGKRKMVSEKCDFVYQSLVWILAKQNNKFTSNQEWKVLSVHLILNFVLVHMQHVFTSVSLFFDLWSLLCLLPPPLLLLCFFIFSPPLFTLMSFALLTISIPPSSHITPLDVPLSPISPPCTSLRGYLVAAPSVFRAGVEESVSVTIFNADAETRVQVQLSVKGQTVAHSHGSVLGENKFWS